MHHYDEIMYINLLLKKLRMIIIKASIFDIGFITNFLLDFYSYQINSTNFRFSFRDL